MILGVLRKAERPMTQRGVTTGVRIDAGFEEEVEAGLRPRVRANLLYLTKVRGLLVRIGRGKEQRGGLRRTTPCPCQRELARAEILCLLGLSYLQMSSEPLDVFNKMPPGRLSDAAGVMMPTPLQSLEATKKLCARSGWRLSNLELQKHLFLAQLEFLKANEDRLIGTSFEAWDFGPVVPEIYRSVKRFAAGPVENIFHSLNFSPKELDANLYVSYDRYKHMAPGQLVSLTHKPRGAWDKNYKPGMLGVIIPDTDIKQEARFGYVR